MRAVRAPFVWTLPMLLACASPARPAPTPGVAVTREDPAKSAPATEPVPVTTPPPEPSPVLSPDPADTAEPAEEPPQRYPFHDPMPARVLPAKASAMQNANLAPRQCRRELQSRKLPFRSERRPAKGEAEPNRVD
jgi:hypothetical protein